MHKRLLLALLALYGCTSPGSRIAQAPRSGHDLDGSWRIRFEVLEPGTVDSTRRAHSVEGIVSLNRRPGSGSATGMAQIDLSRMLALPPRHLHVVASMPSADSVEIQVGVCRPTGDGSEIECFQDGGGLFLAGTVLGHSIVGQWEQNFYCCGSKGRFEMRPAVPSH